MTGTNFVCDVCGQSFDTMEDIATHLKEAHDLEDVGPIGSITQADGMLILKQGDGETTTIDLAESLREMLGPQPTTPQPDLIELIEWQGEGGCQATDGCWVETDGRCVHGHPSWLLRLGLI